jgi:hypothetical protein
MKIPGTMHVAVLTALLGAACLAVPAAAGESATAAGTQELGPYLTKALARQAAKRLAQSGWHAHGWQTDRGWYVRVEWTAAPEKRDTHAGKVVLLKARNVSDMEDGDWQINAGRVRIWPEARASTASPARKPAARRTGRPASR